MTPCCGYVRVRHHETLVNGFRFVGFYRDNVSHFDSLPILHITPSSVSVGQHVHLVQEAIVFLNERDTLLQCDKREVPGWGPQSFHFEYVGVAASESFAGSQQYGRAPHRTLKSSLELAPYCQSNR